VCPDQLARRGIKAIENAGCAKGEDAVSVNGGSGTRTVAAHRLSESNAIRVRPDEVAGGEVVANNQLVLTALFLGDGVRAGDCEGRPAQADGPPPQLLRRMRAP